MAMSLIIGLLFSLSDIGISQINLTHDAHAQTSQSNPSCQKLPIVKVVGSGDDGHVPANVLDGNPNTRWSNLGIGSFIQVDLGAQKTICSIDIAWYRGNHRQNNFVISVSNDGTSLTNALTSTSSGATLSPETYIIPAGTTARYMRIT